MDQLDPSLLTRVGGGVVALLVVVLLVLRHRRLSREQAEAVAADEHRPEQVAPEQVTPDELVPEEVVPEEVVPAAEAAEAPADDWAEAPADDPAHESAHESGEPVVVDPLFDPLPTEAGEPTLVLVPGRDGVLAAAEANPGQGDPDQDPEQEDADQEDADGLPTSVEVRALRAQVRILEQALDRVERSDRSSPEIVSPAPAPAPAPVAGSADAPARYRRQVDATLRGLAARTPDDEAPDRTLSRVMAALKRLDAADELARPVLPDVPAAPAALGDTGAAPTALAGATPGMGAGVAPVAPLTSQVPTTQAPTSQAPTSQAPSPAPGPVQAPPVPAAQVPPVPIHPGQAGPATIDAAAAGQVSPVAPLSPARPSAPLAPLGAGHRRARRWSGRKGRA